MPGCKTTILLCTAAAFASPAFAQLRWLVTEVALRGDPRQTESVALFPFVNDGQQAITIGEIKTSCGCTAAAPDRKTYRPGERGVISAVIHYAADTASTEQLLTVATTLAETAPTVLKITLTLPGERQAFERIEIRPRAVQWPVGPGAATPQIVTLRIRENDAIRPIRVACDSDAFAVELFQPLGSEPHVYRLVITPRRTDAPVAAVVKVTTNSDAFNPAWRKAPPLVYDIEAAVK